ncbi:hypothetical protein [Bartonella sp. AA23NXGY]|uniref:hypothetical protein n=1 Tax=Bartonella sp. AA23NXGY TaxID=3243431 RepID=UPI0035D09A9D
MPPVDILLDMGPAPFTDFKKLTHVCDVCGFDIGMNVIGSADGPQMLLLCTNPSSSKMKPSVKLILMSLSRSLFSVNSLCMRAKAEPTRDVHACSICIYYLT